MLESLVKYWNSESLLYYKHYWSFVTFSSFADWLCPNFPCFISSFEIWISQRGCWKFGKSFNELCSSTFRSVGLWSFPITVRFFLSVFALLMYFYFETVTKDIFRHRFLNYTYYDFFFCSVILLLKMNILVPDYFSNVLISEYLFQGLTYFCFTPYELNLSPKLGVFLSNWKENFLSYVFTFLVIFQN